MRDTKDTKSFWKKCKPLFSNSIVHEKIVLIENDRNLIDEKEISQYFNKYFATITDSLKISEFPYPLSPDTTYWGHSL